MVRASHDARFTVHTRAVWWLGSLHPSTASHGWCDIMGGVISSDINLRESEGATWGGGHPPWNKMVGSGGLGNELGWDVVARTHSE